MKTRSGISRTDFADLIGVGYSRIGQLIRQGLPTNADGSIPGDTAARWYCENIRRSVLKSGPGRPGRLKKDVGVTVSEEQRGGRMSGRRVLDRIIESSTRVPEILCEMGVKDPKVILAARDWFIDAVFAFGGQLATDAYDSGRISPRGNLTTKPWLDDTVSGSRKWTERRQTN